MNELVAAELCSKTLNTAQQTSSNTSKKDTEQNTQKLPVQACEQCRLRHRRCDHQIPCGNCKKKGLNCVYPPRKKRGPKREATKRMREEIEFLQKELLKSKQREYELQMQYKQLQDQIGIMTQPLKKQKIEGKEEETETCLEINVSQEQKKQPIIYSQENSLYLGTLLITFVDIYAVYVHPYRPLLPVHPTEFKKIVPEMIKLLTTEPQSQPELTFLIYAMLTTSSRLLGDADRAQGFLHKARALAGDLFDRMDSCVGCAFGLLAYDALGTAEFEKSVMYMSIARKIGEAISDHNIKLTSALGLAYASSNFEVRNEYFLEMSKQHPESIIGDVIFALVGQVETKLLYNQPIEYMECIQSVQNALTLHTQGTKALNHVNMLHRVLIYGCMIRLFCNIGAKEMTLDYINKFYELTKSEYFKYCCIGVAVNALESVAEAHLTYGMTEQFNHDLSLINIFANRYPLANFLKMRLQKKSEIANLIPKLIPEQQIIQQAPSNEIIPTPQPFPNTVQPKTPINTELGLHLPNHTNETTHMPILTNPVQEMNDTQPHLNLDLDFFNQL